MRAALAGNSVVIAGARVEDQRCAHRDIARPLTPAEHSERIAAGEGLTRYYRHPAQVHSALRAGTTWPEIAGPLGATIDQARVEWQIRRHRA